MTPEDIAARDDLIRRAYARGVQESEAARKALEARVEKVEREQTEFLARYTLLAEREPSPPAPVSVSIDPATFAAQIKDATREAVERHFCMNPPAPIEVPRMEFDVATFAGALATALSEALSRLPVNPAPIVRVEPQITVQAAPAQVVVERAAPVDLKVTRDKDGKVNGVKGA